MIIKARAGTGGPALARYLGEGKNEQAELLELRNMDAANIRQAIYRMDALSKGTGKCEKYALHVQMRAAEGEALTADQWREAVSRYAGRFGMEEHQAAVILHQNPDGTTHCHAVFNRVHPETLKAAHLSHNYAAHKELAREMERDWGLQRVNSQKREQKRDYSNRGRGETEQARRAGRDVHAIRDTIRAAWEVAENGEAFSHALEEEGFILARGTRRDYVAVDGNGHPYSIGKRTTGARAAEVREKLRDLDPASVPTLEEAQQRQIEANRQQEAGRQRGDGEREGAVGKEDAREAGAQEMPHANDNRPEDQPGAERGQPTQAHANDNQPEDQPGAERGQSTQTHANDNQPEDQQRESPSRAFSAEQQRRKQRAFERAEAEILAAEERERQRQEEQRRIAWEKEQAEAARRDRRENKLRVFLRIAFARARAATLRETGDLEGAAKIEENLAREAGQRRYGERVTREQSHTLDAHLAKEAARAERQREREEALKQELGVDRLAKDCPDWSQEYQDPNAWRVRMSRIPQEEEEARAKVARATAHMHRDEIDEGIRELWDCTQNAVLFGAYLERAGLLLARHEGTEGTEDTEGTERTEDARGQPKYLVIDGAGRGYALSESFGRGGWVVWQRMAGIDPSLVPPVNAARAIQEQRFPERSRAKGLNPAFSKAAVSHERTEAHVDARMRRVERMEQERQTRAQEAERGAQAFDHEQQRRADRPKERPEQVGNAQARQAEREALERRQAEERARLYERQRERQAAHAREQAKQQEAKEARLAAKRIKTGHNDNQAFEPTPPPAEGEDWNKVRIPGRTERAANENPTGGQQRPAETTPRTPAARAFEQARRPEPPPEPSGEHSPPREAFNESASPEAEQGRSPAPVNQNKRRPRAQTAEEMRARMKNRGGRERTRETDRD